MKAISDDREDEVVTDEVDDDEQETTSGDEHVGEGAHETGAVPAL